MADDMLRVLIEACSKVRSEVSKLSGREEAYESYGVGAGGDISRKIDIVAERIVMNTIKEHGINCTIIAEEAGRVNLTNGKGSSSYIIVDAVDGTTNALRGIPFYSCSIAFADENRLSAVKCGVVMDLYGGDVYSATKGNGAFLNGARMRVKKHHDEGRYYVVGMNISGVKQEKIERLKPIMSKSNHLRHLGSNALELCIFARGLMDVFIDIRGKIRITDMAAAYLIVKESGGILISEDGKNLDSELEGDSRLSFIAAAHRRVLDDIAQDAGLKLQI
ncbi:MAG: inositol monophosphatase family protein [Nitrososphaerales archaeon]